MNNLKKGVYGALVVLFLASLFISCKHPDPQPSKVDYLVKTWKLSALTYNGGDAFAQLPDCVKDNLTIFTRRGQFSNDEGATKCDNNDPQIIDTGTWTLVENQTKMKITYDDGTYLVFVINQLTAASFKVTYLYPINGVDYTIIASYVPV